MWLMGLRVPTTQSRGIISEGKNRVMEMRTTVKEEGVGVARSFIIESSILSAI